MCSLQLASRPGRGRDRHHRSHLREMSLVSRRHVRDPRPRLPLLLPRPGHGVRETGAAWKGKGHRPVLQTDVAAHRSSLATCRHPGVPLDTQHLENDCPWPSPSCTERTASWPLTSPQKPTNLREQVSGWDAAPGLPTYVTVNAHSALARAALHKAAGQRAPRDGSLRGGRSRAGRTNGFLVVPLAGPRVEPSGQGYNCGPVQVPNETAV